MWFIGSAGCLILIVGFLLFLAVLAIDKLTEPPSFIQPRIVANGPKYEPNPHYPERRIVPEQLKEWADAEIINRITQ